MQCTVIRCKEEKMQIIIVGKSNRKNDSGISTNPHIV